MQIKVNRRFSIVIFVLSSTQEITEHFGIGAGLTSFADCEHRNRKKIEAREASKVGRDQSVHSSRERRASKTS